jgi:hypothetical protein
MPFENIGFAPLPPFYLLFTTSSAPAASVCCDTAGTRRRRINELAKERERGRENKRVFEHHRFQMVLFS